eukprot:1187074-Prorocentrum_minimum.AAC.9
MASQVVFPRVMEGGLGALRPSEAVLVQSFEPGTPLMDWAASEGVSAPAKKVRRESQRQSRPGWHSRRLC